MKTGKPKARSQQRCYGALQEDAEDLDSILMAAAMWLEAKGENGKLAGHITLVSILRWNLRKRVPVR